MSSNPVRWGALAGTLGGLFWALFPLGNLSEVASVLTPRGSLAYYGLGYLLPPLLMLAGSAALHVLRGRSYGWLGNVGYFVSFAALVLVFIGGAWEATKIASTGVGSIVGYWISMIGFFILMWGSGLLGFAIMGSPDDPPSYLGSLLLAVAVPLGFLLAFSHGGAWGFGAWVGLTVPYGVAWVLLGYAILSAKRTTA